MRPGHGLNARLFSGFTNARPAGPCDPPPDARDSRARVSGPVTWPAPQPGPITRGGSPAAARPMPSRDGCHCMSRRGNGHAASVRRLLARGADPNLRDPVHHRTPLEDCQSGNSHQDSPGHAEVEALLRPLTRQQDTGAQLPGS